MNAGSSQRQRCKVCGRPDGFNFRVPDSVWERIVPRRYWGRVVCLFCFDHFALETRVDYSRYISDVVFVGDAAHLDFAITRSLWIPYDD